MMSNIKAIIVDDELNARENLSYLINSFCPNITIIAEASNVDNAIKFIENYQPDLVFLDIEMPNKSGFDLLNYFDKINFSVVFVTAYDKYAIKAFDVSAIDYLLKPIDVDRLKEAVIKVQQNQEQKNFDKRIKALKENTKTTTLRHISIPYKSDYAIVPINDIMVIEANRMYSKFHLIDKTKKYLYAKKLSFFEQLFENNSNFFRIHRSWIINTDTIISYSKKEASVLLSNNMQIPISKSYKLSLEKLLGL